MMISMACHRCHPLSVVRRDRDRDHRSLRIVEVETATTMGCCPSSGLPSLSSVENGRVFLYSSCFQL